MKRETLIKVHTMMHSFDKEMSKLGLSTLRGYITDYKSFKNLRGISIKGKPFFPVSLKMEVREFGRELRKNLKNYGRETKGQAHRYVKRGQGDDKSSSNNPMQGIENLGRIS